jgi:RNase P subunit RPR2
MPDGTAHPVICNRCSAVLHPGQGDFYVVRIEAVADPTPPTFSEQDLQQDTAAEIDRLVEALRDMSEREALDQIFRRMTLHLCSRCYRQWIENPVGEK